MIPRSPGSLHRIMSLSGAREWWRRLHKDIGRRHPACTPVRAPGLIFAPIPLAGVSSCSVVPVRPVWVSVAFKLGPARSSSAVSTPTVVGLALPHLSLAV